MHGFGFHDNNSGQTNLGGRDSRKLGVPLAPPSPPTLGVNLDGGALSSIDVGALPAGDSAFGCRQMLGNTWEWTDTLFDPQTAGGLLAVVP